MKITLILLFALVMSGCTSIMVDKTDYKNLQDCAYAYQNDRSEALLRLKDAMATESLENAAYSVNSAIETLGVVHQSCLEISW